MVGGEQVVEQFMNRRTSLAVMENVPQVGIYHFGIVNDLDTQITMIGIKKKPQGAFHKLYHTSWGKGGGGLQKVILHDKELGGSA